MSGDPVDGVSRVGCLLCSLHFSPVSSRFNLLPPFILALCSRGSRCIALRSLMNTHSPTSGDCDGDGQSDWSTQLPCLSRHPGAGLHCLTGLRPDATAPAYPLDRSLAGTRGGVSRRHQPDQRRDGLAGIVDSYGRFDWSVSFWETNVLPFRASGFGGLEARVLHASARRGRLAVMSHPDETRGRPSMPVRRRIAGKSCNRFDGCGCPSPAGISPSSSKSTASGHFC